MIAPTAFCHPRVAAAALSVLLAGPVLAQEPAQQPPAPDQGAPNTPVTAYKNPHEMLGPLEGGPDGSPTARRGDPLPGTSTSIPTLNPTPVPPLSIRRGENRSTENTGIGGQCDPDVGLGNCPDRPPSTADMLHTSPAASPAAEETVEPGGAETNETPDPEK